MPSINKDYHYQELALKPIIMDKKLFDIDALAQEIATHSDSPIDATLWTDFCINSNRQTFHEIV